VESGLLFHGSHHTIIPSGRLYGISIEIYLPGVTIEPEILP
jgi:hypothetical protein